MYFEVLNQQQNLIKTLSKLDSSSLEGIELDSLIQLRKDFIHYNLNTELVDKIIFQKKNRLFLNNINANESDFYILKSFLNKQRISNLEDLPILLKNKNSLNSLIEYFISLNEIERNTLAKCPYCEEGHSNTCFSDYKINHYRKINFEYTESTTCSDCNQIFFLYAETLIKPKVLLINKSEVLSSM